MCESSVTDNKIITPCLFILLILHYNSYYIIPCRIQLLSRNRSKVFQRTSFTIGSIMEYPLVLNRYNFFVPCKGPFPCCTRFRTCSLCSTVVCTSSHSDLFINSHSPFSIPDTGRMKENKTEKTKGPVLG